MTGLTNAALVKFYFNIRNDSSYTLKLPNGVRTNPVTGGGVRSLLLQPLKAGKVGMRLKIYILCTLFT